MRSFGLSLLLLAGLAVATPSADRFFAQRTLNIPAVYQQTPVWCWAAVGEMVFRYYGVYNINPVGNYQCGIIALLHPVCNQNCFNCVVPAGSRQTMINMLTQYPNVASSVSIVQTQISLNSTVGALSMASVESEINAGRPIIAGISPSGYRPPAGVSQHVALVIGYEGVSLIVNDPFPFETNMFAGDPYMAAGGRKLGPGRYSVPYSAFTSRLRWGETIFQFRCQGSGCRNASGGSPQPPQTAYGRSCRTPYGTCGPFLNQSALPVGTQCYCSSQYGPVYGIVVQP
jgi:hypothetical protein